MNQCVFTTVVLIALCLSGCSGGGVLTVGPAAPAHEDSWGKTIVVQRPSLDPQRQPKTISEEFSEFDPTGEFVMTDVGDITCNGTAQDQFGNFTGGKVRPQNGRFYAVQVEMKTYDNKWVDKGYEGLSPINFRYISPSGKELAPEKIATDASYACLKTGFLPMFTYEHETGSGKVVFDIPNETGGKFIYQRYRKENLPEEEFPLDRSGRSAAAAPSQPPAPAPAPTPTATKNPKPSSGSSPNSAPAFDGALPAPPVDGLRAKMSGIWAGPVTGDSSKYTVRATLKEVGGVLTADVEYPELKCSATWTESFVSGSGVSLNERLKSGKCLDNVIVSLTLDGQGISAFFTGGTGKDIRAVLIKQ